MPTWWWSSGGDGNANRLHPVEQLLVIVNCLAAKLVGRHGQPLGIRVRHRHQLRILQQAQDPGMVPAHVTNPNHANSDGLHGGK